MSVWVDLKSNKPDVGVPVLTIGIDDDGNFVNHCVAVLNDKGEFITGYRFCGDRVIGFFVETFPTHWMALPANPEVRHG